MKKRVPAPLVLVGSGGHAKVVIDIAIEREISVLACIGEFEGIGYRGIPVVVGDDKYREYATLGAEVLVAIGDNSLRVRLAETAASFGLNPATLIGANAHISPTARLGNGTVVMNGAVINADAAISDLVIVNTGATVDHDCSIGRGAHVGPGSNLAGGVSVGADSFIGAGSVIAPGIRIGAGAIVGAGSTIVRDVAAGDVVFGERARSRTVS